MNLCSRGPPAPDCLVSTTPTIKIRAHWFTECWGWEPRLCAWQASTLPASIPCAPSRNFLSSYLGFRGKREVDGENEARGGRMERGPSSLCYGSQRSWCTPVFLINLLSVSSAPSRFLSRFQLPFPFHQGRTPMFATLYIIMLEFFVEPMAEIQLKLDKTKMNT